MLNKLSIKNYALIDDIEIDFTNGLTIITGETGAGKSIILGALSLILGQRSESKYFFHQDKKCIIEGFFSIERYHLEDFFVEHDLDYEKQTILRREIYSEGKSRAFINDSPVNLALIKALAERLIAIHSQHAVLEINKESFQLLTLDSAANNDELAKEFHSRFKRYRAISKDLEDLIIEADKLRTDADYYQFLFDELSEANLDEDEQVKLEEELNKLNHAEEIKRCLHQAEYIMSEQEQSALPLIKEALARVKEAEHYLPALAEISDRLNSSFIELKDISEEIMRVESEIGIDAERLQFVEDRLSLIFKLQQKHQTDSIDGLIQIQKSLQEKIDSISINDTTIEALKTEKEKLKKQSVELASQLSDSRLQIIPTLEKQIDSILQDAGMSQAVFKIELETLSEEQLRDSGRDKVRFLFSANRGQVPQPINKVASGGELSRLMLAIKSIIAQTSSLPTLIFDEIDTGISGEVALKVGNIMKDLAKNLQVIAITHLPQIAAQGDAHFKVFKNQKDSSTATDINLLDQEGRIEEIAQMLGGSKLSETAISHAKELLGSSN